MKKRYFAALSTVELLKDIPVMQVEGCSIDASEIEKYKAARKLLKNADVKFLKEEKNQIYSELATVNSKIRKLKSELRMCDKVKAEEPVIRMKLQEEALAKDTKKINIPDIMPRK